MHLQGGVGEGAGLPVILRRICIPWYIVIIIIIFVIIIIILIIILIVVIIAKLFRFPNQDN